MTNYYERNGLTSAVRFHRTAADMTMVRAAQGYTTPQVRQRRREVVRVCRVNHE